MNNTFNNQEIEEMIKAIVNKTLESTKETFNKEWMSLKEGAQYANVSYNTFIRFRLKGLRVTEIDGIKRVSRKEIDKFLENHSY